MTSLYVILSYLLSIALWLVLAQVVMSWLVNFQVLNLRQPIVYQAWRGLNQLLEPIYSKVRQLLPAIQGLDLAPLFVLIIINVLQIVLTTNQAAFH